MPEFVRKRVGPWIAIVRQKPLAALGVCSQSASDLRQPIQTNWFPSCRRSQHALRGPRELALHSKLTES